MSAFDQPASSLVVLVCAVGENSDEHALFAVPDSERFALLFEELLVPAVSPGPVLESLVADRGPEAGRHAPRTFAARDDRPRDAAVLQRVAPLFDAEVAPCGLIVRLGDVSDRVDPRRARPHGGVCDDPIVHRQTGLCGELDAGPNAGCEEDGPGIEGVTIIEVHSGAAIRAFDAFDLHPEAKVNAEVP